MSNSLQDRTVVHVAEIVRHGDKLLIPEAMTLAQAIKLIQSRMEYEDKDVRVSASFEVFPDDGAHALNAVLTKKYGWAQAIATPSMFGENPPELRQVEVSPGVFESVPWGRFSIPGITGFLQSGRGFTSDGRIVYMVGGITKRRDEPTVQALFAELRQELANHSIYRGKAVKLQFTDDDGDLLELPTVKFMDTAHVTQGMAIYSRAVERQIETNLYTPIVRALDCLANGIPLKRGVALVGSYGTGKTLASLVAAKLAVDTGITFVHCHKASELSYAIAFARQYQSPACVVFCEDIDREASGDRTESMDQLLNIVDGIDSKSHNILVVLTSNDVESINPAMLRPGRLDAVIEVTAPDAEAVERLIRYYTGDALAADADLTRAGLALAGQIPATIAEVVKRAKLAEVARQPIRHRVKSLSGEAICEAAETMGSQVALMERVMRPKVPAPALDTALHAVVKSAMNGTHESLAAMERPIRETHSKVMRSL